MEPTNHGGGNIHTVNRTFIFLSQPLSKNYWLAGPKRHIGR